MPKVLFYVPVVLALGLAFLVAFSTAPSIYYSERHDFYERELASAETTPEKDGWSELIASKPLDTKCLPASDTKPRPTKIPFLGASQVEVKAWGVRNEAVCLTNFERRMRMIKNDVGQAVAQKALLSLRQIAVE